MGEVHEGVQVAENREVVLKSLPESCCRDAAAEARLAKEAELLRRLAHVGIADFVEFKVIGGRPRLVMARVDGVPLSDYLDQPRTVEEKVRLMEQVARAVEHAHTRDVAHRDLKPGNIMVRENGTVVVLDFGIGALTDAGGLPVAGLTKAGTIAGTPHWMAPEQALGACILPKAADVYAMGLLLFHLLSGRLPIPPRPEEADLAYLMRVQKESPRRLREINLALPKALEAVCEAALQREPEARPSAQTFADDLGRWLRKKPVSVRQSSTVERVWLSMRRKPDLWAAGFALVAGLICVAVLQSFSAARETAARNAAEEALAASWQTLAAADAMTAAESAVRGRVDEALPWLARALRRDPRNEMASWMAGQIMTQRRAFSLAGACETPEHEPNSVRIAPPGSLYYLRESDRALVKCGATPDGKGVEGSLWPPGLPQSAAILDFAVSPDGLNLMTVDKAGVVRLRSTHTGSEKWTIQGTPAPNQRIAFSDSAKLAVILRFDGGPSTSAQTIVRCINTESGILIQPDIVLDGHFSKDCCAFTADDNWLVLRRSHTNNLVRICMITSLVTDLSTACEAISIGNFYHFRAIQGTSQMLISGQAKGYRAGLLDVALGEVIWSRELGAVRYEYTVSPLDIGLNPANTKFAALGLEGDIMIHKIEDGSLAGPPIAAGWKPGRVFYDDDTIFLQGIPKSELWNARTGERIAIFPEGNLYRCGPNSYLQIGQGQCRWWKLEGKASVTREYRQGQAKTGFELDGKGLTLIIAGQSGQARIIDLSTLEPIGSSFSQGSPTLKATSVRRMIPLPRISSDGSTAASWLSPTKIAVRMRVADGFEPISEFESPADAEILSIALSPDGTMLVFGCIDGIWEAWHVPGRQRLHRSTVLSVPPKEDETKGEPARILNLEFSGDGERLAIGTEIWCTTSLWNTTDWTALQAPLMSGHGISAICFEHGTNAGFWAANWLGQCHFFDPANLYRKSDDPPTVSHSAPIADCRISPDGHWLATASWDHNAAIWDPRSREALPPPLHHESSVTSVGWSPDSEMLVTASVTGEVYLWDRRTKRKVYSFPQPAAVVQAAFGLNGTRLILARMDGIVVVMELFPRGIQSPYSPDTLEKSAGYYLNEQGSLVRGKGI